MILSYWGLPVNTGCDGKDETMKRIRTICCALKEIKSMDPNTGMTEYFIRKLCNEGTIPCHFSGKKILLDFDALISYLDGEDR